MCPSVFARIDQCVAWEKWITICCLVDGAGSLSLPVSNWIFISLDSRSLLTMKRTYHTKRIINIKCVILLLQNWGPTYFPLLRQCGFSQASTSEGIHEPLIRLEPDMSRYLPESLFTRRARNFVPHRRLCEDKWWAHCHIWCMVQEQNWYVSWLLTHLVRRIWYSIRITSPYWLHSVDFDLW